MSTLFSKIVNRQIPAHIVMEDDKHLAFLDVFPLKTGHVLVIPKLETDYIFDLPNDDLADLMVFAKKVAHKMKLVFTCKKIGVSVVGIEVPHAHIHLIPIDSFEDMNFSKEKQVVSSEELEAVALQLRNCID